MFTIALIGPDGAGKTTIGRRLEHNLPMPVKYLYMGVSTDSSNVMLPTTRLIRTVKRQLGAKPDTAGPPDPHLNKPHPKGFVKQAVASLRSSLRLANRLSEEWFRQTLAWYYQHRGYIVLFDRHFFSDYYAYDITDNGLGRSFSRRIHGFVLKHIYPKPDLVIYLDAPADVLFARKGEGTIQALERRRGDYLQLSHIIDHFATVDANQPEDVVANRVTQLICDFYESRVQDKTKAQRV